MEGLHLFLNKDKLYVLYSSIVILFTSWTIYYHLPYSLFFYLGFTIWTITKYNPYNKSKIFAFLGFLILSLWYFRPCDLEMKPIVSGLITALTICSIFLIDKSTIHKILDLIFLIISVIVAFGIIAYLLRFFNVYDFTQIATVRNGSGKDYAVYLFHTYAILDNGLLLDFRFSSIFDEPGYLGTIAAFYLIYQDFNFKKPQNIVLFIGGLFTLSLAFYIMVFPFLLFNFIKKDRIVDFLIFAIIIVVLVTQFSDLFDIFLRRQEFSGDGFSDSRGGQSELMYNISILEKQDLIHFLFGNGNDSYLIQNYGDNTQGVGNSSIFRLFYQIGILGVLYLISFIVLNVRRNIKCIYFVIAFIFSLYQRPQVFEPIFIILLAANLRLGYVNTKKVKTVVNQENSSCLAPGQRE